MLQDLNLTNGNPNVFDILTNENSLISVYGDLAGWRSKGAAPPVPSCLSEPGRAAIGSTRDFSDAEKASFPSVVCSKECGGVVKKGAGQFKVGEVQKVERGVESGGRSVRGAGRKGERRSKL